VTERDALYAAVLADPDADAPRLVYADWLEEHPRGEADVARAAFIRLEIEAEGLPAGSEARARLETAAARLFNAFGEAWNADVPTWDKWYESLLIYRRGFPFELHASVRTVHYSGGELFGLAPIQSLVVSARPDQLPRYQEFMEAMHGRRPDLSGLRSLWLTTNLGGSGESTRLAFQIVARYPSLRNLERLSLAGCDLNVESIYLLDRALREAVFRDGLRELDLSDNNIQDQGATALSVAPSLTAVGRLVMTGNPLSPLGRRMLANHFGDRVVM
jgi:uncharacterized protein (TIGR02996 family)